MARETEYEKIDSNMERQTKIWKDRLKYGKIDSNMERQAEVLKDRQK